MDEDTQNTMLCEANAEYSSGPGHVHQKEEGGTSISAKEARLGIMQAISYLQEDPHLREDPMQAVWVETLWQIIQHINGVLNDGDGSKELFPDISGCHTDGEAVKSDVVSESINTDDDALSPESYEPEFLDSLDLLDNANFSEDETNRHELLDERKVKKRQFMMKEHQDDKTVPADVSGKLTKLRKTRVSKNHKSEPPASFVCPVCDKTFNSPDRIQKHITGQHGNYQMLDNQCVVCEHVAVTPEELIQHLQKHRPHACEECHNRFNTMTDLKRHMRLHTNKRPHVCVHCNKGFRMACRLKDHMKIHTGEKPYICSTCGKSFGWSVCLKAHMALHLDECSFKCDQCDKAYKHRKGLLQHQNVAHREKKPKKEKAHMCFVCGKSFVHAYLMKQHEVTHTKERPYGCKLCGKTFSWKAGLFQHMREHAGKKSHQCSVCEKRFYNSTQLARHKRTHTGEKPYVCATCGKQFVQDGHLKRHQVVHTGDKPYVCVVCEQGFTQSTSLKLHCKKVHGLPPALQQNGVLVQS